MVVNIYVVLARDTAGTEALLLISELGSEDHTIIWSTCKGEGYSASGYAGRLSELQAFMSLLPEINRIARKPSRGGGSWHIT